MWNDPNHNQAVHLPRRWRRFAIASAVTLAVLSLISCISVDMSNHARYYYWTLTRQTKRKGKKKSKSPPVPAESKKKKTKVKKGETVPAPAESTKNTKKKKAKTKQKKDTGKTRKESTATATAEEATGPELVMLLAFPFSGTNTLLHIVQSHAKKSMATNYGDAIETNFAGTVMRKYDSIPVDKARPGGPFKYKLEWPLPDEGGVLVKTHCSGHCLPGVRGCGVGALPPKLNMEQFYRSCFSATRYSVRHRRSFAEFYDSSRSKKAILLIRNPLDIAGARFQNWNEGRAPKDRVSFSKWCDDYDSKSTYMKWVYEGVKKGLSKKAMKVPCHGELYRIVKFYQNSLGLITFRERLGTEFNIHTVHFEDYDTDYEKTKDGVLEFANIKEKKGGKHYMRTRFDEFYSKREKAGAQKFMKTLIGGDEDLMKLLGKYME
eukprot:CAMPEP_0172508518 /NCGR_PEP_ID=MMETSP1066-20121228/212659_1 /TAXON_ID=671091 /ORGANISM="Coscinodiscus wailesii, Strain CCMP2513" /LENGTH=433 /DNA_ID=CAMNT_0013286523 /DNA_START=49 /DNA_END=1350 /DNA_ORIENTATION=-